MSFMYCSFLKKNYPLMEKSLFSVIKMTNRVILYVAVNCNNTDIPNFGCLVEVVSLCNTMVVNALFKVCEMGPS